MDDRADLIGKSKNLRDLRRTVELNRQSINCYKKHY